MYTTRHLVVDDNASREEQEVDAWEKGKIGTSGIGKVSI